MAESRQTPQVRRHAVDASAIAKWWLDDEQSVHQARALKSEFQAGRVELYAPTHLLYEVANVLRRAVRARRISQANAESAISELLDAPIHLTEAPDILQDALETSLALNLSFYDACYLVVAEAVGGTLISDDRNMGRALGGDHPVLVRLEDYQPE